ncbi:STM3941 family protein [Undibacterium macrobrachii]|jgi:hypothetical protein|uniref:PH domain-containing protein n=1 Tax=Undibacterium macrobrachii TaxID=1119058 RepID=A0ABQ2XG25_9BURK|nr:STM3941 family protein [Undibacterium macrobrachii]GGX14738.1 hypothetical protein GCM10011282_21250 [Undibacterium macrobrachii]
MESVEISLKKGKLTFLWLAMMGGLIFMGWWFITSGQEANVLVLRLFHVAMGVLLLLIAATLLPFGLRLAIKTPGLIIDKHGLTDHSATWQNGFLAWSDIKAIEVAQPEQTAMMFIVLFDPEKYLQSRTKIRRFFARTGNRFGYPSPFGIVVGNLNIEFAELVKVVEQYWGDYHQRSNVARNSTEEVHV